MNDVANGKYAEVNGLNMYYEIHGTGQPLVVLHGAYMTIDLMGEIVPSLAETRQVIAVELQGHGRTADVDRPLSYEQMADDTAALLIRLGIAQADLYGYSLGGGVALQVSIRHPALVRKLVVVSASFNTAGMHPEAPEIFETIAPAMFAGTPFEAAYLEVAPNPGDFPKLVEKLKQLDVTPYAWPPESIQRITSPTMVVIGDSDGIRPEHAVEMFRLLGGGVFGDIVGLPTSRLAVLPATTHIGVLEQVDLLLAMVPAFLDAPMPETESAAEGPGVNGGHGR